MNLEGVMTWPGEGVACTSSWRKGAVARSRGRGHHRSLALAMNHFDIGTHRGGATGMASCRGGPPSMRMG
jgi:hypothetical protein